MSDTSASIESVNNLLPKELQDLLHSGRSDQEHDLFFPCHEFLCS